MRFCSLLLLLMVCVLDRHHVDAKPSNPLLGLDRGPTWVLDSFLSEPEVQTANTEDEQVNAGYFWHVSDMHWDPTYQEDAAGLACNEETEDNKYGKYGDYLCDAPWELINSSIYAMQDIFPDPDFLIWTGDDTPHIYNDTILNQEVVKDIIFDLTDKLTEVFPDHIVYSAMGNHDWSPKHQFPPRGDPFYGTIADKWQMWLKDSQADATFRKGAYYVMPGVNSQLQMIVLNTNFYYTSNLLTAAMPDPGNQLQWLDDLLTDLAQNGTKAMIVAHVPPGQFEKHEDKSWFYSYYNSAFVGLLRKHAAAIGSVHMAHHHTDSFRVVYDQEGEPVTSLFLGPSVTPWETTLPGVMGGAGNNPSIRLVKYDRESGVVLNIEQYYLQLPEANEQDTDSWDLLYNATEYYDIPDLSPGSLADLAEKFLEDDDLFSSYYLANGVAYDPDEKWTEEFRTVHYCAITCLDHDKYEDCIESRKPMEPTSSPAGHPAGTWTQLLFVLLPIVQLFN